eukprot:scaffold247941_cov30-Tisochrysis_lutea.AAC.1
MVRCGGNRRGGCRLGQRRCVHIGGAHRDNFVNWHAVRTPTSPARRSVRAPARGEIQSDHRFSCV